jgi:hypothetical protein
MMTMTMTIEQQLARLADDIERANASGEATTRDVGSRAAIEDVERRVQPVARGITSELRRRLPDRMRLRFIENDEDEIVLALEMVVERLLAGPCVAQEETAEHHDMEVLAAA